VDGTDDTRVSRDDGSTLRLTPQRRAVLEVLRESTDHPTAADVYERVRAQTPGVGAATIYRSLALLVGSGAALELNLGAGAASRYDANTNRHDHLVCEVCSRAVDVDSPLSPLALADLETDSGFSLSGYDLQFRGVCPECRSAASAIPAVPGQPPAAS
jgi:Fe2+ or Zn2+ uptake regulation protein